MKNNHTSNPSSTFVSAIDGLSFVCGIIIAFLLSPQFYNLSAAWVAGYSAQHYGAGSIELSRMGWLIILAFLLFYAARVVCVALFSAVGLWLGAKLISRH